MPGRTSGGPSWSPSFRWISRSRLLPASPKRFASPDAGLLTDLRQSWYVPTRPRPIAIIGAGGVVRTAHLPVYQRLGFPVAGLFDIDPDASRETARRLASRTCSRRSPRRRVSPEAVFDVAVPGDQIAGVLRELPRGLGGPDSEADGRRPRGREIDQEHLPGSRSHRGDELSASLQPERAGAPAISSAAACSATSSTSRCAWSSGSRGTCGRFSRARPGSRFSIIPFTTWTPYARSPVSRAASTAVRSPIPAMPRVRDTRSTVILDYGENVRCSLLLNHVHQQDATHCASILKVEGTAGRGAAHNGSQYRLPQRSSRHAGGRAGARQAGSRSRCGARGSSRRSKVRCRICSGSLPAKTLRSSRPSKMRSRRWRSSRRAISPARPAGHRYRVYRIGEGEDQAKS